MIKLRSIAAMSFAVLLASGYSTSEGIKDVGPSKRIPLPDGASEELKKSIESRPPISISQAMQREMPKDTNDWIKLINKRNKFRAAHGIKRLEQSSVSIRRETLNGVSVNWLTPSSISPSHRNHLFIHLHGGAYLMGAGDAGIQEGIIIAEKLGIAVVSIDYRMPPLHPSPAAVDDVVATYRTLLKKHSNQSIAMGGTSAGGGLTLAATLRFKQLELPLPGALYTGTPWETSAKQVTPILSMRALIEFSSPIKAFWHMQLGFMRMAGILRIRCYRLSMATSRAFHRPIWLPVRAIYFLVQQHLRIANYVAQAR
jgi:monoterpene epsilon-lactone hydrolase